MDALDAAQTVAHVLREAPALSAAQAERALAFTLADLLRELPRSASHALSQALSPTLRDKVTDIALGPPLTDAEGIDGLCENLLLASSQEPGMSTPPLDSPGHTREIVEVVCKVVSGQLPPETRERIARDLPAGMAELFAAETSVATQGASAADFHSGHTLADGRPPVAARPLSEAAPGSDTPISSSVPRRAQAGTVAEANPHADTKVSSSRGLTQQRERESLAEGRPPR